MPLQQTTGNVTTDAYGGGVAAVPNYIEDVFSTYLYTGTGSSQTITNNIDLSGKGGLTWIKTRGTDTNYSHILTDTVRGATKALTSNTTDAEVTSSALLSAFTSSGFTVGTGVTVNKSGNTLASWTFRKQPKFFDVVTYTGDGTGTRNISHNLGSVPGCIIVKCTSTADTFWEVWHRSLTGPFAQYRNGLYLNTTAANDTIDLLGADPTSTQFNVERNTNGRTYVAYLFAHNAGGFGLTGTDNVISCGSFTTDGSGNATVTLGYEPQWVMVKTTSTASNWIIIDTMRGYSSSQLVRLFPNTSGAESDAGDAGGLTATGFKFNGQYSSGTSLIYIAIRRGPMKVPTDATTVFKPTARTGTGTSTTITSGFVNDSVWSSQRGGGDRGVFDRLRGPFNALFQNDTVSENGYYTSLTGFDNNTGVAVGADAVWGGINASGASEATYSFQRAPSYFDEVCYTGTGTTLNVNHNLAAVPELIIIKKRSATGDWFTGFSFGASTYSYAKINLSDAAASGGYGFAFGAQPTTTQFTPGSSAGVNGSGATYVAYLFATAAGVSKVGTYTGTGATQTIDCGFGASGSRFVLIKQTDSTGDWYVWDSARGMVSGTDPRLLLNSTAAEVNTNSVYAVSTGFQLLASSSANVNINGASYIFLAIA